MRTVLLFIAMGSTLLHLACRAPSKAPRHNLLFIVIDALRPDHLGVFGYHRDTSPTIDALARRGANFTNARSAANLTRSSVPSLFTGVYPSVHGVFKIEHRMSSNFRTLAEILHDRGLATAAFMPNPNLRRKFNFGQGFELYDDQVFPDDPSLPNHELYETARRIEARALHFLDERPGRPFFLYLHYRDVHAPYSPPPPYDRLFWSKDPPSREPGERRVTAGNQRRRARFERHHLDSEEVEFTVASYDAEIRYTDDRLAELLQKLEARGRLANTLIVLTADHGEAFFEHGQRTHGNELWEEEVRVPLLILVPDGRGSGLEIAAPVSGVDLLPTLLDLLAIDERPSVLSGESLAPLLDGGALARRPVFAEREDRVAIWDGGWKLIRTEGGVWRLFDLARDPGERSNLMGVEPERARAMLEEISTHRRRWQRSALDFAPGHERVDSETESELRALGYL